MGVDPTDQLLKGPALSMPLALERAGMSLADVGLVDIHEAFAAQVLSVLTMLESDVFAKAELGRDKAGSVDEYSKCTRRVCSHRPSVCSNGQPYGEYHTRAGNGDKETCLLGMRRRWAWRKCRHGAVELTLSVLTLGLGPEVGCGARHDSSSVPAIVHHTGDGYYANVLSPIGVLI